MLSKEDLLTIKNDLLPYVQRYYWRKIDNLVLRNGAYVATDKVRALDSSGLFLADDSSAYGILIADGGAVTIGDGTAAVNIGSDLTMADTKYIATDKVRARDSDGLLLVDDSDTEGLKVEDGGAVTLGGDWRLKTETEGGVERLTVTAVGANAAAELFLHPTGSANTSRLTITDAVNTTNYEGIELEATTTKNVIGSIAAGTGTVQGLEFQISNSTKMTLNTSGQLGIGIAPSYLLDVNGTSGFRGELRYIGTQNTSHFGYSTNEDVYIRSGQDAGKVILADISGMEVGIGTASPSSGYKLHVAGGRTRLVCGAEAYTVGVFRSDVASGMWLGASATTGDLVISNTSGTERVRIEQGGEVGIGITPVAPLHVYGYVSGSGTLRLQGTASGNANISYISFYDSAGTRRGYFGDAASGNDDMYLVADTGIVSIGTTTGGTTTLNVTTSNTVGIQATSSNAPLGFGSSVGEKVALYDSGTASQRYGFGIAASEMQLFVNTGTDITFRDGGYNGTEIMRVDGGTDRVGIGESAPLGKLHVKNGDAGSITPSTNADELIIENSTHAGISILSGSTSVGQISFGDTGSASAGYIQYSHNTNVFAFGAGGSTALWLTSADSLYPGTDNSGSCGTSGSRWTDVYAVSGSVNTSDLDEKKDVANLPEIAGLGFVNALRPVRFRWINGERWHFGIIAQELKARLDERGIDAGVFVDPAVNGEEGPLGIRHHELIAPIIKAIQQLDDRLKTLETA